VGSPCQLFLFSISPKLSLRISPLSELGRTAVHERVSFLIAAPVTDCGDLRGTEGLFSEFEFIIGVVEALVQVSDLLGEVEVVEFELVDFMVEFEDEFLLVVGESLLEDGAQIFDTILGELRGREEVIVLKLG
jgi:hypothetical protein